MRETDWIARYILPYVSAGGAYGLKDDVARLESSNPDKIVTTDMLVEGRHFLPTDPLETVGRKALRVSISDIYAKGGQPCEALLSIAWPSDRSEVEFAHFMSGLGGDLRQFDVSLLGGDLVLTDGPLVLNLVLTGKVQSEAIPLRSGARPGEALWVSGEIGHGGIGLRAAIHDGDKDAISRYQVPQLPSLAQIDLVARHASASMDISDGLLLDANRLCLASGVGLVIELDAVPLAKLVSTSDDALAQCTAGDDYQILMTAPAESELPGFTKIGRVIDGSGLSLIWQGETIGVPEKLGFLHGEDESSA
ncbi:MAG: thiamine-phosphate kinase [Pseudomonadota bacterium]